MSSVYTKHDFSQAMLVAYYNGTLLTPKHDPNTITTPYDKFRSVVSHEVSSSMETLLVTEQFDVIRYEDKDHLTGAGYYEVIIYPSMGITASGFGVPSGSITYSGVLDRLAFFSGSNQGWHVISETSSNIQNDIATGRLYSGRQLI